MRTASTAEAPGAAGHAASGAVPPLAPAGRLVALHVVAVQLGERVPGPGRQRGPQEPDVGLEAEVQEEVDALLQVALHRRTHSDLQDTLSVSAGPGDVRRGPSPHTHGENAPLPNPPPRVTRSLN